MVDNHVKKDATADVSQILLHELPLLSFCSCYMELSNSLVSTDMFSIVLLLQNVVSCMFMKQPNPCQSFMERLSHTYNHPSVWWHMLAYAGICWHLLACAGVL